MICCKLLCTITPELTNWFRKEEYHCFGELGGCPLSFSLQKFQNFHWKGSLERGIMAFGLINFTGELPSFPFPRALSSSLHHVKALKTMHGARCHTTHSWAFMSAGLSQLPAPRQGACKPYSCRCGTGVSELRAQGLQLQSSPSDGGPLDPQTLKPLHDGGDPLLVGPQTCIVPRNILVATTLCFSTKISSIGEFPPSSGAPSKLQGWPLMKRREI